MVGLEDDVDEFRLAGRAKLFIVNPDAAEEDEEAPSLFELLDLRGETAAFLPLLHSTEPNMFSPAVRRILREDIGPSRNMLILDRLEILPEFRRQRLGLRYIQTAIKRFGSGCRIAALRTFPLQFERTLDDPDLEWRTRMKLDLLSREARSAQATLKEYYRREGFVPVGSTDLMILDLGH
jgi:GNAT superfamily N-acetyltransferase